MLGTAPFDRSARAAAGAWLRSTLANPRAAFLPAERELSRSGLASDRTSVIVSVVVLVSSVPRHGLLLATARFPLRRGVRAAAAVNELTAAVAGLDPEAKHRERKRHGPDSRREERSGPAPQHEAKGSGDERSTGGEGEGPGRTLVSLDPGLPGTPLDALLVLLSRPEGNDGPSENHALQEHADEPGPDGQSTGHDGPDQGGEQDGHDQCKAQRNVDDGWVERKSVHRVLLGEFEAASA